MKIKIKILPNGVGLGLPGYATNGASGMDLRAAIPEGEVIVIGPGCVGLVPTGITAAIPFGFEGQVRGRSGLARRQQITCHPGTIDSDYRGEIGAILFNHGNTHLLVNRGDRIAQLIIAPVVRCEWSEVGELDDTERGTGGYGHTGV
jgi:dUTP pyrophosphatase